MLSNYGIVYQGAEWQLVGVGCEPWTRSAMSLKWVFSIWRWLHTTFWIPLNLSYPPLAGTWTSFTHEVSGEGDQPIAVPVADVNFFPWAFVIACGTMLVIARHAYIC
ncbi:hypothetical protein FKM82_000274 [Ascaphus truei]